MSKAGQSWDEAVRQAVESHEFEYEPAAWAGMEQMLDSAGAVTGAAASGQALSWLWGLPAVLAVVGGLLWFALPEPEAPSLEGSLPISTEEAVQVPELPPLPSASPRPIARPALIVPLPHPSLPELPAAEEESSPPQPAQWAPLPALPAMPLPERLQGEWSDDSLPPLPPASETGRKRNRRTLFPDVIERY